jgi:uncharacterized protein YbjT (DUF2867 family)
MVWPIRKERLRPSDRNLRVAAQASQTPDALCGSVQERPEVARPSRAGLRARQAANNDTRALAAAPNTGVNTLTGEGLAEVLKGASVVVDVSNSPSWDDAEVLKFFETSTRNLLTDEAAAGVGHHVALSVVGTDRLSESGYMRAKIAQEKLIKESSIPYSIVHATQFFEFLKGLADIFMVGDKVHLPPVLFQPMAADDVASGLARIAVGQPVNGIVEIAGPEQFRVHELVRRRLASLNDPREVIPDSNARYGGARVSEKTLLPGNNARLGETHFETWLTQPAAQIAKAA